MNLNLSVSIIIPNWNGKKLLEKHLPYVLKASHQSEILVVDDASTDDSVEFIKKNFPMIHIIQKEKNEGFASAVNLGVNHASGELFVLLNTDIEPNEDFLDFLIPHFTDPNIFAVGCLDKSVENGQTILRGRGQASWQYGLFIHRKGDINKPDTAWVSGGSSMFRKKYWRKLGGMDQIFNPFYWEDIDLSYRAKKSGYKVLFESKSIVIHKHEEGAIQTNKSPQIVRQTAYRNQLVCIWKNITAPRYVLEHCVYLPLHISRALIHGDSAFILGFMHAVLLLPAILQKRYNARKLFIMSDLELLPRHYS